MPGIGIKPDKTEEVPHVPAQSGIGISKTTAKSANRGTTSHRVHKVQNSRVAKNVTVKDAKKAQKIQKREQGVKQKGKKEVKGKEVGPRDPEQGFTGMICRVCRQKSVKYDARTTAVLACRNEEGCPMYGIGLF